MKQNTQLHMEMRESFSWQAAHLKLCGGRKTEKREHSRMQSALINLHCVSVLLCLTHVCCIQMKRRDGEGETLSLSVQCLFQDPPGPPSPQLGEINNECILSDLIRR